MYFTNPVERDPNHRVQIISIRKEYLKSYNCVHWWYHYYYHYYFFLLIRVISWLPFTGVWVTVMRQAILNKSWRQHPTKQQLCDHLPPITKTTQVRRTWHSGHCGRSKDELISDIFLWTPSREWEKAGRSARTYIRQLCAYTGCSLEDLPGAMDYRDGWRERVREIRAGGVTLLFTPLEFFTSVLTDGFSLEFEWQQVSSSLQDSPQYSGRSQ